MSKRILSGQVLGGVVLLEEGFQLRMERLRIDDPERHFLVGLELPDGRDRIHDILDLLGHLLGDAIGQHRRSPRSCWRGCCVLGGSRGRGREKPDHERDGDEPARQT